MLKDKVAVITGGSSGIGKATAFKMAEQGANIALIARNVDAAQAVCDDLEKLGVTAKAYKLDVSDFDASKEVVGQIKKDMGGIHILVNSAGVTKDGLLAMMKEEAFDQVIDINLKGTFNMIKHCTAVMMRQRYGKIINVSSVSGIMGNAGQMNYSASKAGVIGMTKSAAKELVSRNINVNAVAPGFIETKMTEDIKDDNPLIGMIPMKRMGKAEEVADAILFLASPASDYITGEVIKVDGGIAM